MGEGGEGYSSVAGARPQIAFLIAHLFRGVLLFSTPHTDILEVSAFSAT